MVTIQLHNLLIHGHHGFYEEERKVVNTFEVSLNVIYDEKGAEINSLEDTIDYVSLYGIVKKEMEIPVPLLEKICQGIIHSIRQRFPVVQEISISIYKLRAPMENFEGKIGVTMHSKFDE